MKLPFAVILLAAAGAFAQTSPAVRRSTPLADDPGMVVRPIPSGTQNVNVVGGGGVSALPDGGLIGTVMQGVGLDGGAWAVQGIGAAGTPGGGVISVQGVVGGTALPISGSITATNPSVSATGAAVPSSATLIGGTNGTNLIAPYVITTTPDAGDPGLVVRVVGGISGGGSGGAVTQGSSPWLVGSADGGIIPVTVENTVPVTATGTVTANQGTAAVTANAWPIKVTDGTDTADVTIAGRLQVDGSGVTQPVSAATLPLPTGAATEATLSTRLADSTFTGRINTLGQKTMANSTPVVLSSDQSAVPVSGSVTVSGTVAATQSGTWTVRNQDGAGNALASSTAAPTGTEQALIVRNVPSGTQAVSGTVTANVGTTGGLALDATLGRAQASATSGQTGPLIQGAATAAAPTYTTATTNPLSLTTAGALRTDSSATTQPVSGTVTTSPPANASTNVTQFGGSAVVTGTGTSGAGIPRVTVSSDSTVTANAGTGTFTVGQATAANLRSQTSSESNTGAAAPTQGSLTMGNTTTAAPTYTNNTANALSLTTAGALRTDSSSTTQPVSGTVTVTQGSAANLNATVTGTVAATQSGTWNINNVSGTVSLPTGAATEATLGTRLAEATFTGRFGAPSLLADATANPTLTSIAGFNMVYNGSTWDRVRGTTANGLLVDVSRIAAGTNYIGKTRITDGTLDVSLLNSAPGSDTGQVSVPVRIISSLAGGAGGTSSSFGAAFPASGTAAGWSDGTNMQGARVFDADTGAGSQYVAGVNLRVSASGGSTEAAAGAGTTSASTLRVVLPTDQTVIPINDNGGSLTVDGTVAATQSGTWNVTNISGTVSLPTGAATAANQTTVGSQTTKINDGTDTALVTAAGALVVDGSATTQPVSGTVTANAGSGTFSTNVAQYGGVAVGAGNAVHVQPGTGASFTVAQATAANLRAQTSAESATAAAVPTNATQVGFRDTAGNLRPGLAVDVDTSGSTIYAQGTAIVGAQFGSAMQAAVEATALPGTTSGLAIREVRKHATSVVATAVTCGTSATAAPTTPLGNRFSICLYNNSTSTIFVGPAAVTTAAGLPLLPGASFCDDVNTTQVYSCIVASGTAELRVLEN